MVNDGVDPTRGVAARASDRPGVGRERQEVARLRLVVEQVAKLLLQALE